MLVVLDALVKRAARSKNRDQSDAVLEVLSRYPGRMLTRRNIRAGLDVEMTSNALKARLNKLEKSGRIVVDREERPVLYGVMP